MPIYEYTCKQCGATFEELLPLSRANDPVSCPECGARETGKNLSTFSARGGSSPSGSSSSPGGCGSGGRPGGG